MVLAGAVCCALEAQTCACRPPSLPPGPDVGSPCRWQKRRLRVQLPGWRQGERGIGGCSHDVQEGAGREQQSHGCGQLSASGEGGWIMQRQIISICLWAGVEDRTKTAQESRLVAGSVPSAPSGDLPSANPRPSLRRRHQCPSKAPSLAWCCFSASGLQNRPFYCHSPAPTSHPEQPQAHDPFIRALGAFSGPQREGQVLCSKCISVEEPPQVRWVISFQSNPLSPSLYPMNLNVLPPEQSYFKCLLAFFPLRFVGSKQHFNAQS